MTDIIVVGAGIGGLAAAYHARKPPRTWSLIVTIFGDHALPRGEAIRLALTGEMQFVILHS